jgi:hypothetical protein
MNRKQAARLIIDLMMTILLLCAYAYRITGDTAHEWIGVSVFVLVIADKEEKIYNAGRKISHR